MKKLYILMILALCNGCWGSSGIEAKSTSSLGYSGAEIFNTVVKVDNPRLSRSIVVLNVDQAYIGSLLKAMVSLQSRTSNTELLQYRWVWYDSKGFEVNSSSQSWLPLSIYGKQESSVQGLAPNPSAKSFKLHLRFQD